MITLVFKKYQMTYNHGYTHPPPLKKRVIKSVVPVQPQILVGIIGRLGLENIKRYRIQEDTMAV